MKAKHWGNLTGAFADLGVLLPLLAALTLVNGINLTVVLLVTGGIYILSGFFFRLPVPVQPLKVACALAISQKLPPTVLAAAGFETALILFLFAGSGLADRLARFFDKPLVRGMQLGVGLLLMERGVALMFESSLTRNVLMVPAGWAWPASSEWWTALVALVIPQVPVTLSNAVVGSADAARRYYRWMAKKVTPQALCVSMGAANMASALAGGIPVCHGSSGWTAHRRLGARGYLSTCLLGVVIITISLLLWNHSLHFLTKIPGTLLGSLLVYVGLRHTLLIWDVLGKNQMAFLALASGGISYVTKNPALGLGVGLAIPKTIDNDLNGTDVTFGFDSALSVATEAVDRLHSTAESHHRVMLVETMGRYAGWIALRSGIAGGGDVILIPEIPYRVQNVIDVIDRRRSRGKEFTIIVVAEGAKAKNGKMIVHRKVQGSHDPVRLGGAAYKIADAIENKTDNECRVTILGHLQRGGIPSPFDRWLATRFGEKATQMIHAGRFGKMVALKGTQVQSIPISEAVQNLRLVDPQGEEAQTARHTGISFGDE